LSYYGHSFILYNTILNQIIESNKAFEKELQKYNIKVLEYHADNKHFAEKEFRDEINSCNQ